MSLKDKIGWALIAYGLFSFFQGGSVLPGVVPGPRKVVILHETAETTPAQSQMFVSLRAGDGGAYFKEKGHSLLILDDDALGADDKPLALATRLNALAPPPSLHVLNGDDVIASKPLPATAAEVVEVVKGAGG